MPRGSGIYADEPREHRTTVPDADDERVSKETPDETAADEAPEAPD